MQRGTVVDTLHKSDTTVTLQEALTTGCLYLPLATDVLTPSAFTLRFTNTLTSSSSSQSTTDKVDITYSPVTGVSSRHHFYYGDAANSSDHYGVIINPAQAQFRVFCEAMRLGQTYLEDYGNPQVFADDLNIRDMSQLNVTMTVPSKSCIAILKNGLHLREVATTETMKELCDDLEVVSCYLEGEDLPEWFIQEAYQQTKQWVGNNFLIFITICGYHLFTIHHSSFII